MKYTLKNWQLKPEPQQNVPTLCVKCQRPLKPGEHHWYDCTLASRVAALEEKYAKLLAESVQLAEDFGRYKAEIEKRINQARVQGYYDGLRTSSPDGHSL